MTYEEAVPIVEACTAWGVYLMLGDRGREMPSLAGYSLAQMVEAQRVVRAHEDAQQKPDGVPRTTHMICDDRLVAALYVATHYQGGDPQHAEPICAVNGIGVFVLDVREQLAAETALEYVGGGR